MIRLTQGFSSFRQLYLVYQGETVFFSISSEVFDISQMQHFIFHCVTTDIGFMVSILSDFWISLQNKYTTLKIILLEIGAPTSQRDFCNNYQKQKKKTNKKQFKEWQPTPKCSNRSPTSCQSSVMLFISMQSASLFANSLMFQYYLVYTTLTYSFQLLLLK